MYGAIGEDSDADVRKTEALEDDAGSATEGRNLVRPSVVPRNEVEASTPTNFSGYNIT